MMKITYADVCRGIVHSFLPSGKVEVLKINKFCTCSLGCWAASSIIIVRYAEILWRLQLSFNMFKYRWHNAQLFIRMDFLFDSCAQKNESSSIFINSLKISYRQTNALQKSLCITQAGLENVKCNETNWFVAIAYILFVCLCLIRKNIQLNHFGM